MICLFSFHFDIIRFTFSFISTEEIQPTSWHLNRPIKINREFIFLASFLSCSLCTRICSCHRYDRMFSLNNEQHRRTTNKFTQALTAVFLILILIRTDGQLINQVVHRGQSSSSLFHACLFDLD